MKSGKLWILLALCLLLSGCGGWMDGSYHSVTLHEEQNSPIQSGTSSASNYLQLRTVLENLVESGTESAVINVAEYDQAQVEAGITMAIRYVCNTFPVGAYAVDDIAYEVGIGGGQPAVSVNVTYRHGRAEIRRIQTAADISAAAELIATALRDCDAGVVILVEDYEPTDFAQLVSDFAEANPDTVMETPQVAAGVYPDAGQARVVELNFTYQTSREALRQMQTQVQPVFASAALYVTGDGADSLKLSQLYAFLMERYDYTIETSITPAYSLLRHGVGDSKAFAMVYAAMCRQAGLECQIVTGTRAGEPWYWNIVCDDGNYYHVDLLASSAAGRFRELTDWELTGYVWDYSAYPECIGVQTPQTEPPTEETGLPTEGSTEPEK